MPHKSWNAALSSCLCLRFLGTTAFCWFIFSIKTAALQNSVKKERSYQKWKSVMGCFAWIIFLRALEIIFSSSDSESARKIRSRNCSICSFILAPGHRPNTSLCSISVPLTSKTFVLPLSVLESINHSVQCDQFLLPYCSFFIPLFLTF